MLCRVLYHKGTSRIQLKQSLYMSGMEHISRNIRIHGNSSVNTEEQYLTIQSCRRRSG